MDITRWIEQIRMHPKADKIGMIATHLGLVRGTSRDGRAVTRIQVQYDSAQLNQIKAEILERPGIVDIVVITNEGVLEIGDVIMFVAIGGDLRENVFPALFDTIERIKSDACQKKEFFD